MEYLSSNSIKLLCTYHYRTTAPGNEKDSMAPGTTISKQVFELGPSPCRFIIPFWHVAAAVPIIILDGCTGNIPILSIYTYVGQCLTLAAGPSPPHCSVLFRISEREGGLHGFIQFWISASAIQPYFGICPQFNSDFRPHTLPYTDRRIANRHGSIA